jgi:hypothetical protein
VSDDRDQTTPEDRLDEEDDLFDDDLARDESVDEIDEPTQLSPDPASIEDDDQPDEPTQGSPDATSSAVGEEPAEETAAPSIIEPETPNLLDIERPPTPPTQWPEPPPSTTPPREPRWFDGVRITAPLVILALLMGATFLMFVGIEPTPRWLLLFAAVMAILGTEGMLRDAWPRPFLHVRDRADTTPYLFLPTLVAVSIPLLIEHNARGYLVIPTALLGALLFTAVLAAQVASVRINAPVYPLARLVSTGAAYFAAFTLLALSYVLELDLIPALITAAIVGTMLSIEIFREGQVDPAETLIFAGVTGLVVAEARWALYFIPIGGYLAGLTLLLAFLLVSGPLHSHVTRHLNRLVAAEYVVIATAGIILVALASQAGLA